MLPWKLTGNWLGRKEKTMSDVEWLYGRMVWFGSALGLFVWLMQECLRFMAAVGSVFIALVRQRGLPLQNVIRSLRNLRMSCSFISLRMCSSFDLDVPSLVWVCAYRKKKKAALACANVCAVWGWGAVFLITLIFTPTLGVATCQSRIELIKLFWVSVVNYGLGLGPIRPVRKERAACGVFTHAGGSQSASPLQGKAVKPKAVRLDLDSFFFCFGVKKGKSVWWRDEGRGHIH